MTEPNVASRIVLGCAQLGLTYGRANRIGMLSDLEADAVVQAAWDEGVRWFDTARAYGLSEARLGAALSDRPTAKIVTKLDPAVGEVGDSVELRRRAEASLSLSLSLLGASHARTILLHRAAHRTAGDGAIWTVLEEAMANGRIGAIGVSVTTPRELMAALADPSIGHVQFPSNILDHRWRGPEVLAAMRHRPDVTFHVRSVYLQGILLGGEGDWPAVHGVDVRSLMHTVRELAREAGQSVEGYCVAYVLGAFPGAAVVLGAETDRQVRANAGLAAVPPLTACQLTHLSEAISPLPDELLDPARWRPR